MKEKLLNLFKQCGDDYLSGEELSRRLGVTRAFVWKLVRELEQAGYTFEAKSRRGYRLLHCPDILSAAELLPLLHTRRLGKRILFYPETDSTNTELRRLAEQGEAEGTVVTASVQTAGKARHHGTWLSEIDAGVYLSVLLRPTFSPARAEEFDAAVSDAVCGVLSEISARPCSVGADGGILLNGEKVCGILIELGGESDCVDWLIIGVGINISTKCVPGLSQLTGRAYRKTEVAAAILHALDHLAVAFAQS